MPPAFLRHGHRRPCSACRCSTLFAVVVLVVAGFYLRSYRSGRELYAIGSDPDAARLSGIPVGRRVFAAFVASGALAGLAGVLYAARFGTLDANAGLGSELNVVAAVVVGGVAIFGGSGSVYGAALGAVLLTTIGAALPVLGINPFWQRAAVGALILAAIGLDRALAVRVANRSARGGGPVAERTPSATRGVGWRSLLGSWDAVVILARRRRWSIVGSLTIDGVASPRFWRFVTLEIIPIALIALPMTLIVITGEIDLSVASILGLTCTVMGQLWSSGVTSLPLLIALCLVLGAVLGAVNGTFITGLRAALARGHDRHARALPRAGLRRARRSRPSPTTRPTGPAARSARFPAPRSRGSCSWSSRLAVVVRVVLHATPIGRGCTRWATTPRRRRFAGDQRRPHQVLAVRRHAARCPPLAGVFWTLRFASARADNGTGLELSVVAAVLLGGVSIFGGRGGLVGVIAAVVLLGTLRNALQLAYVPANTLTIVTGGLLIASVVGPNVVAMVARAGCAGADHQRRTAAGHPAPAATDLRTSRQGNHVHERIGTESWHRARVAASRPSPRCRSATAACAERRTPDGDGAGTAVRHASRRA